jgi:toluene monooxygenase system ferredoxin subunit
MEKSERKAICKVSDVPENELRECEAGPGRKLCIVNAGDRFFACQAACPHEGIALCDGTFDGEVLTCLEHLWQWNLREGGEPKGLAEEALAMFAVEVEDGAVYLKEPLPPA